MRARLIIYCVLAMMLVLPTLSYAWWNTTYTYKKPLNFTQRGDTNFQVFVNVSFVPGKMQSDFRDLRFINGSDIQEIPYWIEYKENGNYADVWIKGNFTNPGNSTQAFMYYGNGAVDSASSINNTMVFGDEFNGIGLDQNKWNFTLPTGTNNNFIVNITSRGSLNVSAVGATTGVSSNFGFTTTPAIYEYVANMSINGNGNIRIKTRQGVADDTEGTNGLGIINDNIGNDLVKTITTASGVSSTQANVNISNAKWHKIKMKYNSSNYSFFVDNVLVSSLTTNIPVSTVNFSVMSNIPRNSNTFILMDYMFSRKFNESDIIASLDAETLFLNITAFDESTNAKINSFTATISDSQFSPTFVRSNSTTTGSVIFDSLNFQSLILTVSATGYNTRTYSVNLNQQTFSAYLLNNSASSATVNFYTVDPSNAGLPGVTITIQRLVNTTYSTIGIVTTDSSGQASIDLENGITYTGIATKAGLANVTRLFSTTSTQPVKFIFGTGGPNYIPWLISQINATCQKVNASRRIFCIANDTSGLIVSWNLKVLQVFENITSVSVCDISSTTIPSASFNCSLPALNVTYSYILTGSTTSITVNLVTDTWSFNQTSNYGLIGVLGAMILFAVSSFVFLPNRWGIIAGILFGYFSIAAAWAMQLIRFGDSGLAMVISLGLVATVFVVVIAKGDFQ